MEICSLAGIPNVSIFWVRYRSVVKVSQDISPIDIKKVFFQFPRLVDRVDYYSNYFLGKPYLAGAQGEGVDGEFDRSPLYRFDCFDCVTYVNNVLALSLSKSSAEFERNLLKINYYNSTPTYEKRFHFMSCDWNTQNQKNKIVKDITKTVLDANGEVLAIEAIGDIDKPNWYCFQKKRVPDSACVEVASIPFLPLDKIFDAHRIADTYILSQIPHASIIEIVRPNWDLRDKIGTKLHVSHLGFVFQKNNQLVFRHASSKQSVVVEVPLLKYLQGQLEIDSIRCINIQSLYLHD